MSLLLTLRAHTAVAHADLENRLQGHEAVRSRADYCALLTRYFTLYEPLENHFEASAKWAAPGWEFDGRRKTPWLREDLRALGVAETELAAWPRCSGLPELTDLGAMLGALYVVEGATLGGQLLARQFRELLGVTAERGARFFHGYGLGTAQAWRQFGQWAETQNEKWGGGLVEPASATAREMFGAFSNWLSGYAVEVNHA